MRKFEIKYNDGVFAQSIKFNKDHSNEFILEYLKNTIEDFNKNPNKDYHITMKNIKEIK